MATLAGRAKGGRSAKSLTPDLAEKAIAGGAALMLAVLLLALARGWESWGKIPLIVWLHVALIATALALTPLLMLRRRGTRWHRRAGWAWSLAMAGTAAVSLWIGGFSNGHFSWIHILSVVTLVGVWRLVTLARAHRVPDHRVTVRLVLVGALLIAGVFTLIPTRTLGFFLFG